MLSITDISIRLAGRLLIDHGSAQIMPGARVGFVGRNGVGKSTLFRAIRGELPIETGGITIPPRWRIGSLAQEAPDGPESLIEVVLKADLERAALLHEAETAHDPHRIADIQTRLVDIDAHSAPARAAAILSGLGFSTADQARSCSEFSGGWRMRVALAATLFAAPDLLLLDEPTNYLDLEGTLWLEKYLATYPYTVFMISHDRDLLNKAVNSIVHLERGKLTYYSGGYDTFEDTRRMQMELNNKSREKTLEQIAHMQKFVDRFRYKASKAKQAQARIKMIERLKPPAALFDEYAAPFKFQDPKKIPASPMITFDGVSVGYGDHVVLRHITNRIDPDDRIALVGVNGNGKSTFAKLLAGDLKPMDGEMRKSKGLDIAYFAQHQMDKLKPEHTPLEHVIDLMPYDSEAKRRSRVAQMGLTTSRMDTPVKNLSGGERARLLLGLITFGGPGMLILDEPTNHLDIDSRDALVEALNEYMGAVLIISHDRHLIEATVDKLWIAQNGAIEEFDEDLDSYQRMLTSGKDRPQKNAAPPPMAIAADRKAVRQDAAAKRLEVAPLRKSIKEAEQKLGRLRTELEKVEAILANPRTYDGAPERVALLGKDKARFAAEIAATEERWLALSSQLEDAERV